MASPSLKIVREERRELIGVQSGLADRAWSKIFIYFIRWMNTQPVESLPIIAMWSDGLSRSSKIFIFLLYIL